MISAIFRKEVQNNHYLHVIAISPLPIKEENKEISKISELTVGSEQLKRVVHKMHTHRVT